MLHEAPDYGQYNALPSPERFLDAQVGKRFQGHRNAQMCAEKVLVAHYGDKEHGAMAGGRPPPREEHPANEHKGAPLTSDITAMRASSMQVNISHAWFQMADSVCTQFLHTS